MMEQPEPKADKPDEKPLGIGDLAVNLGGRAIGFAVGTVGKGVDLLGSTLRLPGLYTSAEHRHLPTPGDLPGIEHVVDANTPPEPGSVEISCIDYSETQIESQSFHTMDAFLESQRPEWATVRWIRVNSIHPYAINRFREVFGFHTLTAEDILHVPQRPRAEFFDDHVFVVMRMLQVVVETSDSVESAVLDTEQVSLLLYDDTLITFQERPGDAWRQIRERLGGANARLRKNQADYLMYSLLDSVVDHCFPVLEKYGDILETLELSTLENPAPEVLHQIHSVKRELTLLRRILWPTREVVDRLYREEDGKIGESTRPYLRDVYEHTIQVVEIIESYREMANGLTDLYMSAVSNKMNEVMKVLTIMASVFIPLTFVAGIYGMNFVYMPELSHPMAYPMAWLAFVMITVGMIAYFRHRGWIGKD